MEKQLNFKYSASQAINSGMLAAMLAFASIYLLDKGLSNSNIGSILALCSVASIIIQTFFANVTEKIPSLRLQEMLVILLLIVIMSSTLLLWVPSFMIFFLAILVAFSFAQSTTPFVNSLAFIYEDQGIQIKYGVGRAYGSLAYAIVTLILGFVIEGTSPSILPFFYIGFALLFIFIIRSYKLPESFTNELGEKQDQKEATIPSIPVEQQSFANFTKRYQSLIFVIIGLGLALFAQTMVATFMIQVVTPLGGDSSSVGLAIFIAAIVEVPVLMRFDTLLQKRSTAFWLKLALVFYVIKVLVLMVATNIFFLYLSQLFQAGSFALAYPAAVQYIKETVDQPDLFKGQTLFTIGTTLSSVFANLFGGFLLDQFGVGIMVGVSFGITVLGAIVIYASLQHVPNEVQEVTTVK